MAMATGSAMTFRTGHSLQPNSGNDSVVVKLLTATVDRNRVRFTVAFVGRSPASTRLSDVDLFIDDTLVDPHVATPSGLHWLKSGGIVLGRSVDQLGQPHAAVLHLTPGLERSLVETNQLFAVVSGSAN